MTITTIKSYTDINQSKKLAEFLPIESADMYYEEVCNLPKAIVGNYILHNKCMEDRDYKKLSNPVLSPAWSLAALLSVLPNEIITDNRFECHYQIHVRKYDGGDNTTLYQIAYGTWHDMINTGEKENLIDCCAQMIIKLKEMNLI